MQVERDEAIALLRRGIPVLATGPVGTPSGVRELRSAKDVPREPDDTHEGRPLEFHRLRDDSGNWTRAGMEHAIRSGGSVMHRGTVIERVEDLPGEAELAAADQTRLRAEAERIDGQIAELAARRAAIARQGQEAAEAARRTRAAAREERLADDVAQGEGRIVAGQPAQAGQPSPGSASDGGQQPSGQQPSPGPASATPGPKAQDAKTPPGRQKKE